MNCQECNNTGRWKQHEKDKEQICPECKGKCIDLFDHHELLPKKVQSILLECAERDCTYDSCERMKTKLLPLGFTFDYYLDAVPHSLRKI